MRRALALLLVMASACSVMHPDAPDPIAPLIGTEWVAEDIGRRGVLDRLQSTLRFDAADAVSGRGGCNRYRGPLQRDGDAIRIGPLAATRIACPPAVMDQEQRFFAALQHVRRLESRDGKLFLLDAAGTPVVTLSR